MVPGWPRWSSIRFLNAARSYPPFRIFIGSTLAVRSLEFTAVSSYRRMASGYRSVTVSGQDGYIYLQKTLPFQDNAPVTVAVVQTAGGLDLVPTVLQAPAMFLICTVFNVFMASGSG